jgi:hypothetical protein
MYPFVIDQRLDTYFEMFGGIWSVAKFQGGQISAEGVLQLKRTMAIFCHCGPERAIEFRSSYTAERLA